MLIELSRKLWGPYQLFFLLEIFENKTKQKTSIIVDESGIASTTQIA